MKLSEFRVRAGSWPENLQVFMQIIGQNQIVRHAQAMRLHGVVRPVVVSTNFFVIVVAHPFLGDHRCEASEL
jgi:hypothetical protein